MGGREEFPRVFSLAKFGGHPTRSTTEMVIAQREASQVPSTGVGWINYWSLMLRFLWWTYHRISYSYSVRVLVRHPIHPCITMCNTTSQIVLSTFLSSYDPTKMLARVRSSPLQNEQTGLWSCQLRSILHISVWNEGTVALSIQKVGYVDPQKSHHHHCSVRKMTLL